MLLPAITVVAEDSVKPETAPEPYILDPVIFPVANIPPVTVKCNVEATVVPLSLTTELTNWVPSHLVKELVVKEPAFFN